MKNIITNESDVCYLSSGRGAGALAPADLLHAAHGILADMQAASSKLTD